MYMFKFHTYNKNNSLCSIPGQDHTICSSHAYGVTMVAQFSYNDICYTITNSDGRINFINMYSHKIEQCYFAWIQYLGYGLIDRALIVKGIKDRGRNRMHTALLFNIYRTFEKNDLMFASFFSPLPD